MRTSELAHQGPDRLAHRGGHEVELHWSRPPRPWWPVLKCRSVAGFELSTEVEADEELEGTGGSGLPLVGQLEHVQRVAVIRMHDLRRDRARHNARAAASQTGC